ncbi:MAG: TIR domain-containing protein [Gammaproteobacteria bacterium]|nr:TIR domain-containing protein [Gammaproteobacteria bacterium]
MKKPPLQLYLLAHPASETAGKLATSLMAHFVEPPASGGLRLPVMFTPNRNDGLPPPLEGRDRLDLNGAEHSLVVVLADARMARTQGPGATGDAWKTFLGEVIESAPLGASPHHVLPVALDENAFSLSQAQHILPALATDHTEDGEDQRLAEISLHIAARAIQLLETGTIEEAAPGRFMAPVRLFISHAKADLDATRDDPAHQTMQALTDLPIEHWFDAGQIAPGQQFERAIRAGIRDCSIMLAFYTDQYGSRPWCRREVLDAKSMGAHILVVDALRDAEPRLFPYLGNVPTVRWQYREPATDARRIVERAVREALRFKLNRLQVERQAEDGEVVLAAAPEAVTLAYEHEQADKEKIFLYPDPPLGHEELDVLQRLRPNAHFLTPLTRLAARYRTDTPAVVGVSISASHNPGCYGLSAAHQDTLSDEVHLYLLAAGVHIAYGGALKGNLGPASNLTLRLFELVRGYSPRFEATPEGKALPPIRNFPPWPLSLDYGDKEWALFGEEADYVETPRPTLPWKDDQIFPSTVEGWRLLPREARQRYAWARGLSLMRKQMTEQTHARIVIGGSLIKFLGLVPGVVEEAYMSLRIGHPLFLVGAFGGAARAVSDLLMDIKSHKCAIDFDFTDDDLGKVVPDFKASVSCYAEHGGEFIGMTQMGREIREKGKQGLAMALNNGLDDVENEELIYCLDPLRIAELVLTGLSRLPLVEIAKT